MNYHFINKDRCSVDSKDAHIMKMEHIHRIQTQALFAECKPPGVYYLMILTLSRAPEPDIRTA